MYIEEDELNELRAIEGIHRDDVAMIIDTSEDYDDLVNELRSYFKIDEKYYKEKAFWESVVKRAMDKED
ncbi:hypothetical protein [Enterococcus mediterraneensis]|uniref:hypothetical protein n=1 Tax=Enterococcus mediterraneensis TaxID=2364791 RepID=UPI000F0584BD|nr:hypothetical protein [Enterococcus mediterraneensis]